MFGVTKEWVEKRIHDFFDSEATEVTTLLRRVSDLELEMAYFKAAFRNLKPLESPAPGERYVEALKIGDTKYEIVKTETYRCERRKD